MSEEPREMIPGTDGAEPEGNDYYWEIHVAQGMRKDLRTTAGVLVLSLAIVSVMLFSGSLEAVDHWLYGIYFHLQGPLPAPEQVVIVAMDAASVERLGTEPWPLDMHGQLLRKLDAAGAKVVAFDIHSLTQIADTAEQAEGARQFSDALANSRCRTVLPVIIESGTDADPTAQLQRLGRYTAGFGDLPAPPNLLRGRLSLPAPALSGYDELGCINIHPDSDGVLRAVPLLVSYHQTLLPSLALATYRQWMGDISIPIELHWPTLSVGQTHFPALASGEMLLNYFGGHQHFPVHPYYRVLSGDPQRLSGLFRDRIVLVGPFVSGATQVYYTPTGSRMTGIEVTANAVASLLTGSAISRVPVWAVTALMVLLTVLMVLLLHSGSVLRGILGVGVLLMACIAVAFVCFQHHVWFPVAGPVVLVAIAGLVLVIRLAIMFERLRAEADIRLQSRLQALSSVSRLIQSSLARPQLLTEIVRWVETELGVEAASVLLVEQSSNRLRFEIATGEKGEQVKDFTLALGEGIAGIVAQTGEPLIVNDARTDPRRHPDIPMAIGFPVRNILCVPMYLRGQVIGVVEVMNKHHNLMFTQDDADLLTVIVQQATLFLESARLYAILQHRIDYANTELRQANFRLASEKAKIETMVGEMLDGIIATDEADRIVLINEAAENMLGLSADAVVGEPLLAVIRQPELLGLWASTLSSDDAATVEEVEIAAPQNLWLRASVALFDIEGQAAGKCMMLTDITELKLMDDLKTDLIGFVSHELKTPLTNIRIYNELVHDQIEHTVPEAAELAEVVHYQTVRMQRMVEDFLNLSRIEADRGLSMNRARLDSPEGMISELIAMEARGRTTHRFEMNLADPMPPLWVDPTKLEAVFANLVHNALKFSPNGGKITVTGKPANDMVQFSVSDEGLGIADADMPNLFERFRRVGHTTSRIPGTGLGLYVSKHLIEAHGGTIWAESTEGEGSAFHFTVPIYSSQDTEPDDAYHQD
ncbi:MAG: CHASE2 domain-containing protein [candidate division WS1 bacterium]|nr:CHASE2 domain-containing protein [candidate division WS1 bacterium]